ncbi:MAG: hypothetical protein A3J38_10510 [Gammaproteobacteria bacterium RIFCSPHIGHO2_12_FULL_45_9]|nr:MAG: hypothetical protein A3J38_10510 [Gammaproteobacteria bacterium RIFCSPHIGHO2_12_FULL_45_9]
MTRSVGLSALCVWSTLSAAAPSSSVKSVVPMSFTPAQVTAIQQITHDYLIQHPEVLLEASQALQKQMEAKQQQAAMGAIQKNVAGLFQDPLSPVAGNPKGSVVMVEFFDYQCGHCKQMTRTIDHLVTQNKQLKIIFKELPIFGNNSEYAAQASLAAAKQGKYFAFHQALLSVPGGLNPQTILQTAKTVGLDVTRLQQDMKDPTIAKELQANQTLARDLQLAGTPTFVLANGALTQFRFVPGAAPEADLQKLISSL